MNLLNRSNKKLIEDKTFIFSFILFILVHLVLFGINAAEWGDSYRILRASTFLREFSYPADEKRLPLFSMMLATWPGSFDPLVWGRIVMLVFSSVTFVVFYKFLDLFSYGKGFRFVKELSLALFIFNPVFLYWSLRIMADVPFALFVLVVFYLLALWKEEFTNPRSFILGLIVGFSALLRFEAYLLFVSSGFGILFLKGIRSFYDFSPKNVQKLLKNRFQKLVNYVFGFLLVLLPYFYFRNPLNSTYFEEPGRRVYDVNALIIYVVSLIFIFGFTSALFFFLIPLFKQRKAKLFNLKVLKHDYENKYAQYFLSNPGLTAFVFLELVLILLWPAAIPRLFVAIIPLMIIPLAMQVGEYFEVKRESIVKVGLILFGLLGVFALVQIEYRLQFLVPSRNVFFAIIIIQLLLNYAIIFKSKNLFRVFLYISLVLWSVISIWIHKDIFRVIREANLYTRERVCGIVAHNDVSSVTDWYLNVDPSAKCVSGIYYDLTIKENSTIEALRQNNIDYAMVTNEHNTDLTFDVSKRPYLEKVVEFENMVNGKLFFTNLYRVKK